MSHPPRQTIGSLLLALLAAGGPAGSSGLAGERMPPASVRITSATAPEVLDAVREGGGRVTLVNVWASWCIPCIEEMPEILKVRRKYREKGMELILVSGDFEREPAIKRLAALGVDFPSFIKEGDDMAFIDALNPDWSGALPASFLYDETGRQVDFWEGKITERDLDEKIHHWLNDAETSAHSNEDER